MLVIRVFFLEFCIFMLFPTLLLHVKEARDEAGSQQSVSVQSFTVITFDLSHLGGSLAQGPCGWTLPGPCLRSPSIQCRLACSLCSKSHLLDFYPFSSGGGVRSWRLETSWCCGRLCLQKLTHTYTRLRQKTPS